MDVTTVIVSVVVASLGLLTAILGFSAEAKKLNPSDIVVRGDQCVYPRSPALALGVCAAVLLPVAQVTFSVAGGCCGCCKSRRVSSKSKRVACGVVCAFFSWTAAVTAWVLFVAGAALSADVARPRKENGNDPECERRLPHGTFVCAAVLTLVATALAVTSYIMQRGQRQDAAEPAGGRQHQPAAASGGIAMGYPQFQHPQYHAQPQGYGQAHAHQFPPTGPPY